ncbi:hypothetical protein V1520DRAFT_329707 [Lipomyces starkeyi]
MRITLRSARASNSMIANIDFNVTASAHADREQQLYQTALHFLVQTEPEQYLEVQLSFESYEALEEQARNMYGDKKYLGVDTITVPSKFYIIRKVNRETENLIVK